MWQCFIGFFDAICLSPIKKLQGFKAVRFEMLISLYATHVIYTVRANYERVYGDCSVDAEPDQVRRCSKKSSASSAVALPRRLSGITEQEVEEGTSSAPSYPREHELQWRHFPEVQQWYIYLKRFITVWLCYIMLRYVALEVYPKELNNLLAPLIDYPVHCILLGRFLVNEDFSSFLSSLFASVLLLWTLNEFARRPRYLLSSVYFVLLTQHDVQLCLSRVRNLSQIANQRASSQRLGFALTTQQAKQLRPRELFLLETMCFKMNTPTGVHYVLRRNRTAESHAKLRQFVASAIYAGTLFTSIVACWILIYCCTMIALDSRYLRVYRMCDSRLQHLQETNQLGHWSVTPTWPRILAACADFTENIILWVESGFFLIYGTILTCFVNYDLLLHWDKIDGRINELLVSSIRQGDTGEDGGARQTSLGCADEAIRELQAQIMDFFGQVRKGDALISDALKVASFGWLYFVASFTFFIQGNSMRIPLAVVLILLFIIAIIFIVCINFLELHRRCSRSYPSLCSLVAHEKSTARRNLSMVLDMYVLEKSCYTLLGQYPFVPTTLITIVGYSVSCFFLISGLLQERVTASCKSDIQT